MGTTLFPLSRSNLNQQWLDRLVPHSFESELALVPQIRFDSAEEEEEEKEKEPIGPINSTVFT